MTITHPRQWALPAHGMRQVPPGEAAALLKSLRHLSEHDRTIPIDELPVEQAQVSLDEAYRICVDIIHKHSRSFSLGSYFLPYEKRQAVRAFYALCRTSDDLVDQTQDEVRHTLARWVALVQADEPPPDNAVLLAWHDTATHYNVPHYLIDELLAGVAMDLTVNRYATFDDLWLYCYRVASVVGLVTMHITGYHEGATPYAISLGVALQLTNILRDVGEDAVRGRIYLPQEDLARFDLCDDDLLQGRRDDRFRALMRFEIERAHALYEEAWPGIALLSRDSQFSVSAAAEIYRGILAKIEANDYDVFTKRAHLTTTDKVLMLPRIYRRLRHVRRHYVIPSNEVT
ncbi:MAG: squalene synthase [Chloroflexi bacterium AL-W]|nr:squalene synthase [Chloroflexi bacterium AL-N1]NOK65415.1 squalene synthase [Chloroflexi bacterium AL-N10]NOK72319.1 squalene synthase [Chloroflexi bacterium AL-N5]NOK79594.1 squalene synthase [Chloroflexi bacterium AL-W]NOK87510.1 squalene synthase [Chloroflexi bacterium AL-N15]